MSLLLLCSARSNAADPPPALQSQDTNEANNSVADTKTQINRIDRELLLEYINLARYNIQFYTAATHLQPWRSWTYPLLRESGTATSLAGTLIDLEQRARGLYKPGKISKNSLRKANICSLTGSIMSGSASGFELAQNTWVQLLARKHGYSPAVSVAHVREVVRKTDALLQKRAGLVATISSAKEKELRELESLMFNQIQVQILFEFRKWSCHSRDQAWRENSFYIVDALQNYTNASSSMLSLRANANPHLRAPSVICGLVSSSAATINPLLSELIGIGARLYQRYKLSADFPSVKPELPPQISAERIKALREESGQPAESDLSRVAMLEAKTERIDHALSRDTNAINKLRSVAQQKAISGPVIGMASLSRNILATVAQFEYRNAKIPSTRLLFVGRIPQAAGQTYAITNTAASGLLAVVKSKKLKERGELPAQIFARRMQELDLFEAQVRAGNY